MNVNVAVDLSITGQLPLKLAETDSVLLPLPSLNFEFLTLLTESFDAELKSYQYTPGQKFVCLILGLLVLILRQ